MPRFARRKISGFADEEGWEVSEAGIIYRHRNIQPITGELAGLPTVDLGRSYAGKVLAAGCSSECPLCLWNQHHHRRRLDIQKPVPSRHVRSTLRLVEEVVLLAFHGEPPHGWDACHAHHRDANRENNAATNLCWETDLEFLVWQQRERDKALLRPSNLKIRGVMGARGMGHYYSTGQPKQPLFTGSASVPGHLPTTPQRIGAA